MVAVDDHRVAIVDALRCLGDAADDRNVESPRDDRDMGRRRAFLQHQSLDPPAGVIQQLGRPHRMRDEDEFGRRVCGGRTGRLPGEHLLQTICEILQIEQALAQIGFGDLHHPAARFVAHLLHRRLGREPAAHRLVDPPEPAAIGGEHPIGLDDVAVLAGAEPVAGIDQRIDGLLHLSHGLPQPPFFGGDVLGDDLPDHDPGFMQYRRADRQPGVEPDPIEPHRHRRAAAALRHFQRIDQFAAGGQLCDDHRDRLQYLDLVLGVMARCAVLHDQHAEHPPATQDRHSHQRVIDFLAGFRAVGELRMALGVVERQRPLMSGDIAHQALAHPQPSEQVLRQDHPHRVADRAQLQGRHAYLLRTQPQQTVSTSVITR